MFALYQLWILVLQPYIFAPRAQVSLRACQAHTICDDRLGTLCLAGHMSLQISSLQVELALFRYPHFTKARLFQQKELV